MKRVIWASQFFDDTSNVEYSKGSFIRNEVNSTRYPNYYLADAEGTSMKELIEDRKGNLELYLIGNEYDMLFSADEATRGMMFEIIKNNIIKNRNYYERENINEKGERKEV